MQPPASNVARAGRQLCPRETAPARGHIPIAGGRVHNGTHRDGCRPDETTATGGSRTQFPQNSPAERTLAHTPEADVWCQQTSPGRRVAGPGMIKAGDSQEHLMMRPCDVDTIHRLRLRTVLKLESDVLRVVETAERPFGRRFHSPWSFPWPSLTFRGHFSGPKNRSHGMTWRTHGRIKRRGPRIPDWKTAIQIQLSIWVKISFAALSVSTSCNDPARNQS